MSTKATSQDTTISIIHGVFGTAHFILQSAADLVAHGESKLVEKVTKGEISYADNMRYRKLTTFNKQQSCIEKYEEFRAKMNNKEHQRSLNPVIIIK